jgi:23S rRNA (guanosine2251-2'-O)-methyltransferase
VDEDILAGVHAVEEALRAGRRLKRLLLGRRAGDAKAVELEAHARRLGVPVEWVGPRELDRFFPGKHQGIIGILPEPEYSDLSVAFAAAEAKKEPLLLMALDQIEDPQNLGAIIRTCEVAGVHGVIIPERGSAGLTTAVHKASAGASLRVPVVRVTNLAQTLRQLKRKDVWIAGADGAAKKSLFETDLKGPLCLVMGNEGEGLRRLTAELCDFMVKIPMRGEIGSLNVSVAAAILLFERLRQASAPPRARPT